MGLVSFLVSANETAGSSGAASPAVANVRASRRDTPFSDARDRLEWAAPDAVRFSRQGAPANPQGPMGKCRAARKGSSVATKGHGNILIAPCGGLDAPPLFAQERC